jgi:hypothetical protein
MLGLRHIDQQYLQLERMSKCTDGRVLTESMVRSTNVPRAVTDRASCGVEICALRVRGCALHQR